MILDREDRHLLLMLACTLGLGLAFVTGLAALAKWVLG